MKLPVLCLLAVFGSVAACFPGPRLHAQQADIVLHAGTVLLSAELPARRAMTIVIRDGIIAEIEDGYREDTEAGAQVIDLRDAFVMPGLIDTHVHLTTEHVPGSELSTLDATDADLAIVAADNAEKILRAGFTTIMDLGNGRRQHEKAVYAVRNAIATGRLRGPEILAAGSPISAVGYSRNGRLRDEVDPVTASEGTCWSPASCRLRVLEQLRRGADFINVYHSGSLLQEPSPSQTLTDGELAAIAETAAMLERVVIADGGNNAGSARGTNRAIELGFGIIDTVTYFDDRTFGLLESHGGYFAPHVYALEAAIGDTPATLEQGSMGWLPRPILEKLYALKQQPVSARAAYEAGARLLLASDSGVFPHGDNANELLAWERLGIPARDVLVAATLNPARAFRLDHRTGSLAVGKEADIVVFADNPLKNLSTVMRPVLVMADGRILRNVNE